MIDWNHIFTNPADAIVFAMLFGTMTFCIGMAIGTNYHNRQQSRRRNNQEK